MKKTSYLLLMAIVIIVTCVLQCKTCCETKATADNSAGDVNAVKTHEATRFPFAVKDANGSLALKVNDNFNFKTSQFNYEMPISEGLNGGIAKLKQYLVANKGKSLDIVGYYTKDEKNTSMYPNLGLARANKVKNYLVEQGIPSERINTFGELKDDIYPDENGIYYGPLAFNIKTGGNQEDLAKLLQEIKANPLVLHFQTGKSQVNLTAKQKVKFANISKYLDKVADARCLIVGHTDNVGSNQSNMVLGQRRANFAKSYLIKNAVSESKIEAISKGENRPIVNNRTERNRAKNRRTEITIK